MELLIIGLLAGYILKDFVQNKTGKIKNSIKSEEEKRADEKAKIIEEAFEELMNFDINGGKDE